MSRVILLIFFCVQLPPQVVESARILGIFPMPSISHQVVFRALMMELANRGHELVILTPNPALPKERPPDNITEIDTAETYQFLNDMFKQGKNYNERGILVNTDVLCHELTIRAMIDIISYQFNLTQVQKLLKDKTQKFDLVIVEAMANYPLIVSHIFNAPAILFSSFYGYPEHLEVMGAVSYHPIYYPNLNRQKLRNLSLLEKIKETYLEYRLYKAETLKQQIENKLLKERFGPDTPTIKEMQKNVQMLFLNSHPIFGDNRPVPPGVVYLGGLHMQPVKPLPQDLKAYLDSSTRGVVYVSLGSNVRPSMMHQELLEVFLHAFEVLPYNILWKFDGKELAKIPKNVKIQEWFPQRDLLVHPNIKAFVTQGGLQSTDEAIASAVPLVGIPTWTDQWVNTDKYIDLGIGIQLDSYTFAVNDLVNAVNKVIKDESYKKNIERLRAVMQDQPQTPLERGVWWTEHVLRHGGAHLRAPSANTSWSEYLMLDVIVALVAVALGLTLCACCAIVCICKRMTKVYKLKQN